jgi:N-acetylmuramoyl-L-alanine amidase
MWIFEGGCRVESQEMSRRKLLKGGGAALAGWTLLRVAGPAHAQQVERAMGSPSTGTGAMAEAPRIITARKLGLTFVNRFGELGPELNVTGHYSATARARDWQEGVSRARAFHRFHKSKNWGGIAYHFLIPDDGSLICARPTILKGTHVGGHNTRNLGVNMPGTTGNRPTKAQWATYRWLLRNAHTEALPKAHRTDVDLRQARLWGHKEWSGQSTACPGLFLPVFKAGLKTTLDESVWEREGLRAPAGEYPDPVTVGDIEADHEHVSPEEAEEARDIGDEQEWLPDEDPGFDEEGAARGAEMVPTR